MKTKPTLELMVSAMLLTALTGNGKAIPMPIDGTISFPGSSNGKDANIEDAAYFINFRTVKRQEAGTVPDYYKITAGAAVVFKPSTRNHADASATTKPLKSSKSRGKKNALHAGSPGLDPLSPSSWILSGFGTPAISGPGLEKQATSGHPILTGQSPVESGFTLSPPAIVPYPATQSVQHVPDAGATALLLGLSMCGLGWLKRNMRLEPAT